MPRASTLCAARRPTPPSSIKSNTNINRMFVLLPGQDRTRHGSGSHRDAERARTNRAGSKLAGWLVSAMSDRVGLIGGAGVSPCVGVPVLIAASRAWGCCHRRDMTEHELR